MDTSTDSPISPTRTAMTVGAVTAVLMFVAPVLPLLNLMPQTASLAVFVGGIFFGMRRLVKHSSADITYSAKAVMGIKVAFFASLIIAFVIYFITKIEPQAINIYLGVVEQMLQSSDLPSEAAATQMQMMREMISPLFLAVVAIFMFSFIGVIAACICGLFLKKK